MLKSVFAFSLAIASLSASLPAYAVQEGHGGVSLVCRDSKKKIVSAQLLDLFEGRNEYGYQFQVRNEDYREQIHRVINLLRDHCILQGDEIEARIIAIMSRRVMVESDIELILSQDAFPLIRKRGCSFEQVATYAHDDGVMIQPEIFEQLSETHKAALYVHEAIYLLAREELGVERSTKVRKAVAYLFSEGVESAVLQRLIDDAVGPMVRKAMLGYEGKTFAFDWWNAFNDRRKTVLIVKKVDPVAMTIEIEMNEGSMGGIWGYSECFKWVDSKFSPRKFKFQCNSGNVKCALTEVSYGICVKAGTKMNPSQLEEMGNHYLVLDRSSKSLSFVHDIPESHPWWSFMTRLMPVGPYLPAQ